VTAKELIQAQELIRLIAVYLPQFHPIAENSDWWGPGFTEWSNVVKARPLFRGHYQPHLPADLGFYDLRLPEVREEQANLAREHGIYGFCYYHYWFGGRRLLERPLDEVLASGKPDFPFCICWANEPWTRVWDGGENQVLMPQTYSPQDDLNHIRWLIDALRDDRYIRVNGRPLLLVYRPSLLPDPKKTAEIWRDEAARAGIPELYLGQVEHFPGDRRDPRRIGFDTSVEFQPDYQKMGPMLRRGLGRRLLRRVHLSRSPYAKHRVHDYRELVRRSLGARDPEYPRIRCVTPGYDNSPRRASGGTILKDSTPELYEQWLVETILRELQNPTGDGFIFLNAWNEWAEGNHLEPCQRWGKRYLESTNAALQRVKSQVAGRVDRALVF
jgi:lipopolysaccharide biosynthesis protein